MLQATAGPHSGSAGLTSLLTSSALIRRSSSFRTALFCLASATRKQQGRSPIRLLWVSMPAPRRLRRPLALLSSPASSPQTAPSRQATLPAANPTAHRASPPSGQPPPPHTLSPHPQ